MIGPLSRYGLRDGSAPKFVDQMNTMWVGTRQPVVLPVADDDHYLRPLPGERPDQLAARVPGWSAAFGDDAAGLWWIIADQPDNQILNPLTDFVPDRPLRGPSADRVADLLSG